MKTYSVYLSEDLVSDFDDKVWDKIVAGELERDTSRSEVISKLMEEWVQGNWNSPSKTMKAQ